MNDRDELARLLMSDAVIRTDAMGRDYALVEADVILESDWLRNRDAQKWEEGYVAVLDNAYIDWITATPPSNPYRSTHTQQGD